MKYLNVIWILIAAMLGGLLTFGIMQTRNASTISQTEQNVSLNAQTAKDDVKPAAQDITQLAPSSDEKYPRYTSVRSLQADEIDQCGDTNKTQWNCVAVNFNGEVTNYFAEPRIAKGILLERDANDSFLRIIDVPINEGKPLPHGATQVKVTGIPFEPEARHREIIIDWGK